MAYNPQAAMQVNAFAQHEGLLMAMLWTTSFFLSMYVPQSSFGGLIALATPFVAAWRLRLFRDNITDGVISTRRGTVFLIYTFFYASILFALAQWAYFQYLDNGRFMMMLNDAVALVKPQLENSGMSAKDLETALSDFESTSPIELAITFFTQNMTIGLIMSLPIALICHRKTRKQDTIYRQ